MATHENSDIVIDEAKLETLLAPYRRAIEQELVKVREPTNELAEVASEFLESGGKRIRPSMCLLACEAIKGTYEPAMPIAVAYELAHAASLTQDDIIDQSPTRHNRQTVHTKHGVTTAILVSDMLIFKIFDRLESYAKLDLPKGQLAQLIHYVAKSAKEAAEGEFLEMKLSKKSNPSVEEYLRLASLKTGALFGAAAASGAIVGGCKPRTVGDLYEFGKNLGISFQTVDDVLDLTGTQSEMGKPMMKDMQNDAMNIVIVHALSKADSRRKNAIRSMIKRTAYGMVDVVELLGNLDDLGSVEYAERVSEEHALMARDRLKRLPESQARLTLENLTSWIEVRRR